MKLNPLWDLGFATFLLGLGYGYYREAEARAKVSTLRQTLFYFGLFYTFALTVGPVPRLAVKFFWVHMIQHISLMMLIAPLLVLGSPVRIAAASKSAKVQDATLAVLRSPITRFLLKAPVGFAIFLAVLIGTHFSPLADLGMTNTNFHSLEIVLFLIGGVIYYYPVMEGNPQPSPISHQVRVISLFGMMVPETMVGFFLYAGNRVLHSLPKQTSMKMGLADQHQGGSIMWGMGMLIDSLWVVLATRDWFSAEQQAAKEEDAATTHA